MPVLAEIALSPVGLSAAFAAGVISFISPCVWPLVPAYLSYISGVSFNDLADQTRRVTATRRPSCSASEPSSRGSAPARAAIGDALTQHRRALEIASGVADRASWAPCSRASAGCCCSRSAGCSPRAGPPGRSAPSSPAPASASAGRPASGPTLAAILALAGRSGHALDGAILLAVYSLGLGVPFLLSGLLFTRGLSSLAPCARARRCSCAAPASCSWGSASCSRSVS